MDIYFLRMFWRDVKRIFMRLNQGARRMKNEVLVLKTGSDFFEGGRHFTHCFTCKGARCADCHSCSRGCLHSNAVEPHWAHSISWSVVHFTATMKSNEVTYSVVAAVCRSVCLTFLFFLVGRQCPGESPCDRPVRFPCVTSVMVWMTAIQNK